MVDNMGWKPLHKENQKWQKVKKEVSAPLTRIRLTTDVITARQYVNYIFQGSYGLNMVNNRILKHTKIITACSRATFLITGQMEKWQYSIYSPWMPVGNAATIIFFCIWGDNIFNIDYD